MPTPVDPMDALHAYVRVQTAADRRVLALLRQAKRDADQQVKRIVGTGVGDEVRRDQARQARAAILERTAAVLRETGDVVKAGKLEAAAAADRVFRAYDRVLMAGALDDPTVQAYLAAARTASTTAVDLAEKRLLGRGYITLSKQVYRTGTVATGIVDSAVNSALARGLSAREFAAEVVGLVDPATPGGASYAALRLARTELNNSFHARSIADAQESPWTSGMLWTLSGSHPRPDECNEYAAHDDGHGVGVYGVDDVPEKPHPHCLCVVTPVDSTAYNNPTTGKGKPSGGGGGASAQDSEDAWLDAFFAGDYDEYIGGKIAEAEARPRR